MYGLVTTKAIPENTRPTTHLLASRRGLGPHSHANKNGTSAKTPVYLIALASPTDTPASPYERHDLDSKRRSDKPNETITNNESMRSGLTTADSRKASGDNATKLVAKTALEGDSHGRQRVVELSATGQ